MKFNPINIIINPVNVNSDTFPGRPPGGPDEWPDEWPGWIIGK